MAEVVEVTSHLGSSIIAIAHGAVVTIGETGDVFAPVPLTTVSIDTVRDHAFTVGLLTIDVRRVTAAADRVPRARIERRPAAYIAISLLVHLAVWGTSARLGPPHPGIGEGTRHVPMLWAHPSSSARVPELDDAEDAAPGVQVSMSLDGARDGVGPQTLAIGNAGVERDEARRVDDSEDRRAAAIADARSSGILGSAVFDGARPFGDIPGTGSPAVSLDDIGSITGTEVGEMTGAFAVDRQLRAGCSGDDCGTIGAGRYATLCGGSTPDTPCDASHGAGYGLGSHQVSVVPDLHFCDSLLDRGPGTCVSGQLDKAIIRRHLRRKHEALRYCYERALVADAQLAGVVETTFVIDATGRVRDVAVTGIRGDVEACITSVIESIRFPAARNGGLTRVRYPVSFHVAGG